MSLRATSASERNGCLHLDASPHLVHRQVGIYSMWYRPCLDCGAWLPLGPSDEEPVRVEVRAAEIARHYEYNFALVNVVTNDEMTGWSCHLLGRDPVRRKREIDDDAVSAGYLARCIVEHEETP